MLRLIRLSPRIWLSTTRPGWRISEYGIAMVRAALAKLKAFSRGGEGPDHVSLFFPFLIISLALGVLAWRSYQLSLRMESGASTLAAQYARYAAEITTSRVDSNVRSELVRV